MRKLLYSIILSLFYTFNIFSDSTNDPKNQVYISAYPYLNIRSKPDISSEVVGKLAYGEKVSIYETSKDIIYINDNEGSWSRIKKDNIEGWIFNYYTELEPPLSIELIKNKLYEGRFTTRSGDGLYFIVNKDNSITCAYNWFAGGEAPKIKNCSLSEKYPFTVKMNLMIPLYDKNASENIIDPKVIGWEKIQEAKYLIFYDNRLKMFLINNQNKMPKNLIAPYLPLDLVFKPN